MNNRIQTIIKTPHLLGILIASVLVSVLFPIADRYIVYPQFSEFLLENTEEEAIRTARYLSLQLSPDTNGITEHSLPRDLVQNAEQTIEALGLMKIKVFSSTGETLFSTTEKDIGVINKHSYFADIVSKGRNYTKLVRKNTTTLEGQATTLDVVETYVPVIHEGSFAGAFEIYYDITDRVKILDRLHFLSSLILVAVATILLFGVIWVVRGAAISIEKREQAKQALIRLNEKLEERVNERTKELSFEKDRADFANKSKSEFLANMSHELRTPLNSVIAYSEVLMNETFGSLGNGKNAEYVADIHRSGELLLEHIGDILDISRIEAGELELEERDVDLLAVIPSLISMVSVRAHTKDLEVDVEMEFGALTVKFDERQFKQIVLNLLSNAIKFTDTGGTVSLAVNISADRGLALTITDSGIGIAKDDIPKILEPFSHVASSQTRSHSGTGLGLAIVKSLVTNHGGKLSISSEPGVGTTVLAEFPIERVIYHESLMDNAQSKTVG